MNNQTQGNFPKKTQEQVEVQFVHHDYTHSKLKFTKSEKSCI